MRLKFKKGARAFAIGGTLHIVFSPGSGVSIPIGDHELAYFLSKACKPLIKIRVQQHEKNLRYHRRYDRKRDRLRGHGWTRAKPKPSKGD